MNPGVFAALGTAGLVVLTALLEANDLPALGPVVLLSAAWAYREAGRLEVDRYEGWMARTSIQVAIRVALFWIIAFPAFLLLRQRIVRGQAEVRPGLSLSGGAPPPSRPAAGPVRPERARKLNRFAVGCAALALAGIVAGLAWAQLSPGTNVGDLHLLCAMPVAAGAVLALVSRRDGGAGFRFAASVLAVPFVLLTALVVGSDFVSQPVRELVFRGHPLPPSDLFPERVADLSRTMLRSQWFSTAGCPVYAGYYRDAANASVEVTAELCPAEADVAATFEARVAHHTSDETGLEALRTRQPSRAEFASLTCPAAPCRVRVLRKTGARLFELNGDEDTTLRLERALWRAEG